MDVRCASKKSLDLHFERSGKNKSWTMKSDPYSEDGRQLHYRKTSGLPYENNHSIPCYIANVHDTLIRTAKVHAEFRLHPLLAIQKVQDIMCSMIRFECTLCDVRFPTFHPDYTPSFTLDVLRHCSNEVAHWEDEKRPGPPTEFAETYRGRCKACELSLKKVEDDECLKGVAVFLSLIHI